MRTGKILIIVGILVAILVPALAYDYENGVYCEKVIIPWLGGYLSCSDGRIFTTYMQMNNYYTSIIEPQMTETIPEYTYVIGGSTEGLSGQ